MKVGIDYVTIYAGHIIVSDKWYIGQTTRDFDVRKYEHIYDSFKRNINHHSYNCAFHRAIRKYGEDSIEWFIIEDNIPVPYYFEGRKKIIDCKTIDKREIYWIACYNSYEQGYNMTKGGHDTSVICGVPICQYTKDGKKVGEYKSVVEASRKTGINITGIFGCLSGRNQSAGGYIWKYASDDNLDQIEPYKVNCGIPKSICQYTKDGKKVGEYKSVVEASRLTGISCANISCCLTKKSKSAGGYYWAYAS